MRRGPPASFPHFSGRGIRRGVRHRCGRPQHRAPTGRAAETPQRLGDDGGVQLSARDSPKQRGEEYVRILACGECDRGTDYEGPAEAAGAGVSFNTTHVHVSFRANRRSHQHVTDKNTHTASTDPLFDQTANTVSDFSRVSFVPFFVSRSSASRCL